MQTFEETARHRSPGGRPQPLAFHGGVLWIGSWDTDRLYAMDPHSWTILQEIAAPGRPYGLASVGESLFAVVALDDDDRYLFRFSPGGGFDASSKSPCPDVTGSHLAADGASLYLCQQGKRRILAIDDAANVQREIALPARCGGFAFDAPGSCAIISADADFDELALARIDVREASPAAEPIAPLPADARGLAFDGKQWWTSLREEGDVIAFTSG